jgi:hypothetical protein
MLLKPSLTPTRLKIEEPQRPSSSFFRYDKFLIIRSEVHKGGTNPNEGDHVTVEYKKDDDTHVTTKHVPVTFPADIGKK